MAFADLHIHSIHSYDGTASIPAILKYTADHTDISVLAITDHNSMTGVKQAVDLAPNYNLEVIPGCEVSSREGHVLTLFVDRPIKAGLSLIETVIRAGDQGGICVAAHPMAKATDSLTLDSINKALDHPEASKYLLGVEIFNGGLVYTRSNQVVADACREMPLAQLGNSDAHILTMLGQGSTEFPGSTAADLRWAIEAGTTTVRHGHGLTGAAVLTAYIPQYLLRKMGWVTWNRSPEEKLVYTRLAAAFAYEPSLSSFSAGMANP